MFPEAATGPLNAAAAGLTYLMQSDTLHVRLHWSKTTTGRLHKAAPSENRAHAARDPDSDQFGTAALARTSAFTVTPRSTLNAACSALSSFSSGGT